MRSLRNITVLVLAFLACAAREACAQGAGPLTVWMQPMGGVGMKPRTGGPLALDVTFNWSRNDLLTGRLSVILRDGPEVLGEYVSAEVVLARGQQTFRMMLPPVRRTWQPQVDAVLAFHTDDARIALGRQTLFLPTMHELAFTLCVSDPWGLRDEATNQLIRALRLDLSLPRDVREEFGRVSCVPARVKPEDMPVDPLHYCCFDVVVLRAEGFTQLREKPLDAIGRWVQAGGSVCVVPEGVLETRHVDFLNDLTGKESGPFGVDVDGRLVCRDVVGSDGPSPAEGLRPAGGFVKFRSGLGRSVVMLRNVDGSTASGARTWGRASAFLWKVQHDRQARWSAPVPNGSERRRQDDVDDRNLSGEGDFYESNAPDSGDLVRHLLPQSLRLVPTGLIILLLAAFVLVVGPGDYMLLGLLRRRKYTWVLFPALSVAFALFMVFLSERYMGSTDERHAMVFVDVGPGGRVIRVNRYELIFSAGSGTTETELEGCFFAPTSTSGDMYYYNEEAESGGDVLLYSGRLPTRYTVRQEIRKWSPQLNRVFSLEWDLVDPDLSGQAPAIRFDAVDVPMLESAAREGQEEYETNVSGPRGRLRETLVGAGDFHGDIYVIHSNSLFLVHRGLPRREYREDRMRRYEERRSTDVPAEFVYQVSVRKSGGVFSVLSQVSPTAGAGFDDLAVLDRTAADEYLLIVMTRIGDDTVVYRRLYCGEE